MILTILYWVILVLCFVCSFGPPAWPSYYRFSPFLALFIIIGLRDFRTPIN